MINLEYELGGILIDNEYDIGDIETDNEYDIGNIEQDILKIEPIYEELTITPTLENQIKEGSFNKVIVEAIETEELNVTSSVENQNYTGLFGEVNIKGIPTEELNAVSSVENQTYEGLFNKVNIEAIETEELNIVPSKEQQVKEGIYNKVTVKAIESEELIITPMAEEQIQEGMFDKVTVVGDEELIPENIKKGVSIFNVEGSLEMAEDDGSKEEIEWKDVVFIDFDGTPLYSYSMEEVQELTELPPLPIRKGFTYQGWNWTLEDIKVQKDGAIVGAHCVTSDGLTRLYLEVDEYTKEFVLGFCQNKANGFLIDWGDGTSQLSGTNTGATNNINKNHTYPKAGKYVITLTPQVSGVELYFAGTTTYASLLIRKVGANSWIANSGWSNILKKVELSEHFKTLNNYGLYGCRGLETINIPMGTKIGTLSIRECCSLRSIVITNGTKTFSSYGCSYNSSMESISLPATYNNFGNYTFAYNGNLKHIRCPNDVLTIGTYVFREDYNLERFRFPEGLSSITTYMHYNNYNLKRTHVPYTVNDISSYAYYCCYSLKYIKFEGDITRINANAFYRCMNIKVYDFTACTYVPTLASTSAFTNIGDDAQIVVPDDLYDSWIEYTNWSNYAGYIVKESEYNA